MADRIFYPVQSLNPQVKIIAGSFAVVSTAITSPRGQGYTATRTGTGAYLITLDDAYNSLLSAQVSLQLDAVNDMIALVGATDVSSAKTIVINTGTATDTFGATDLNNANDRCHFVLFLSNTNVVT